MFISKFRSNLRQNVFKNVLNYFEHYFRLQHRRKTKKSEENHCDRFDQPANFNLKHSALKTKETANNRIKVHTHTCLPSKKLLSDFQAFSEPFKRNKTAVKRPYFCLTDGHSGNVLGSRVEASCSTMFSRLPCDWLKS